MKLGARKMGTRVRRLLRVGTDARQAYKRKAVRAARRAGSGVALISQRLRIGSAGGEQGSLESRSVGLPSRRLVKRCSNQRPDAGSVLGASPSIALAFSGGGFRASLAAAGVLRFAADAHMLPRVRYVSSVSGGSITHGLFAASYTQLEATGFSSEKVDELVVSPLMRQISDHSLTWGLIRHAPELMYGKTRADLLSDALDNRFFDGCQLARLPQSCRFTFNAANLATGVRFTLEPRRVGDYVIGYCPTADRAAKPLRLADAVAASAAFPGAFSPFYLDGYRFHCPPRGEPPLVDGGVYDNLGLEALNRLPQDTCIIGINAGGLFHTGFTGGLPVVGSLRRDTALLYRQSTALRTSVLVERFQEYEKAVKERRPPPSFARRGVLFNLATTISDNHDWDSRQPPPPASEIVRLAELKTSFSRFKRADCEALVYRGWWLTGAAMSKYHRDLLPSDWPDWRPLPR